jgi:hypothetical protein
MESGFDTLPHTVFNASSIFKDKIQKMTRQDLDDGIIQISDSHGTNRWLVIKKKLEVIDVSRTIQTQFLPRLLRISLSDRLIDRLID